MSIFKNSNESVYVGGRKHWSDVIKNSGSGEYLIWRQPEEDFNTNSTLIVMPGEEAVFINGGRVEETFTEGTYKLSTENYPFISRLRNAFTGGISIFNCVVYFVRKTISKELLWGSDSPIQVRDQKWGVLTSARARGAYKIYVDDSVLFLRSVIGNNIPYQTQDDLCNYFEIELSTKIKSTVSSFLNYWPKELIGLDAYLPDISEQITPQISNTISSFGLGCVVFSLLALDIDTTKYEHFDEINIKQYEKIRESEANKQTKIIGAEADAETKRILAQAEISADTMRAEASKQIKRFSAEADAEEKRILTQVDAEAKKVMAHAEAEADVAKAEGTKQIKRLMGEGDAAAMSALGDNWAKLKAGEILNTVAQNPGAGGIAATGAGIGMGFAAGNVFASMADQMFAPMNRDFQSRVSSDFMQASGRFEQVDEQPIETQGAMIYRDKLRELKALLDEGLIEQSEYDETKKEILEALKR